MRRLLLLCLSASLCFGEVDYGRLLRAIAEKETGNKPKRGAAGELTPLQILPATWRRFSRVPMASATPREVDRVGRAILSEIQQSLRRQKLPETPLAYALRWNAGANAYRFSSNTRGYALFVSNLYDAL